MSVCTCVHVRAPRTDNLVELQIVSDTTSELMEMDGYIVSKCFRACVCVCECVCVSACLFP